MANTSQIIEHFFGVYLLYCNNLKYVGRTYIGYTVDPKRRIKQHNAGKKFGGAWRTSERGPWEMVLIIHGFPNSTSALRFEWAWQHPELSRRLKHIPKKKTRQKVFEYRLQVLTEMLKVGPWSRLPLTVRWLNDDFGMQYSSYITPPMHMPITYGKVTSKKTNASSRNKKSDDKDVEEIGKVHFCHICSSYLEDEDRVECLMPDCGMVSHLICLANTFSKDDMVLPVEGSCSVCTTSLLWGDLIRKKIGCNMHIAEEECDESDSSTD